LLEQLSTNGGQTYGLTVTVKLQLVVVPQESLALHVTVVMPSGKLLPLGGMQLSDGGGLHPPEALLEKKTTAEFEQGCAVSTMFDEQLRRIGGRNTVTVKLQLVLWPQPSLAMHETLVVPIGKVLPLGGLQLRNGGGVQPPEAELV
jgi:hypothetical protein